MKLSYRLALMLFTSPLGHIVVALGHVGRSAATNGGTTSLNVSSYAASNENVSQHDDIVKQLASLSMSFKSVSVEDEVSLGFAVRREDIRSCERNELWMGCRG